MSGGRVHTVGWMRGVALGALVLTLALASTIRAADQQIDSGTVPSQPRQPTRGPGSSDYAHARIATATHGHGERQYWLFTPDSPKPATAPVVVFLHGWSAMRPDAYGAWIVHLVRHGNIVIYPRYQEHIATRPATFAEHAVAAIRDALERLESQSEVQPDMSRVAFVGHSMGALLSANIAQNAKRLQLPAPRALFLAEPAFEPILGRYDEIPADTLLVVAVGADAKRDSTAERILRDSSRIPTRNKNYIRIPSDVHGHPPLISDHFAPCAAQVLDKTRAIADTQWHAGTRNAIDYYGYWKLCDGLLNCAFFGRDRKFALGDTAEVRFMGLWSDGTPVREATVVPTDTSFQIQSQNESHRQN